MASKVTVSDRVGTVLKEVLVPDVQKNFWRLTNHPMLRILGMEVNEQGTLGTGSPTTPRAQVITEIDVNDNFEIYHMHTPFGGGVHATAEDVSLRKGKFSGARSTATTRYIQGSFELTRQAIAVSRSSKLALTREVRQNAMGAARSVAWNLNRMIVGNGSGILCYIDDNVAATTAVQVQTNTSETNEVDATMHLNKGDELVIGTSAEILAGSAESVTVSEVTGPINFTAASNETLVDDDIVIRADAYDTGSAAYVEVNGFTNLINNTGTTQGINKANYAWFQSTLNPVSGDLTENKIDTVVHACRRYAEDPSALFLLMNSMQWRRYDSTITTTKNTDASLWDGNAVGGIKGLTYYSPDGRLPCLIDDMVPDGLIWVVDPNAFMWGEVQPFGFAEDALSLEGTPGQRKAGTLNYEFAFWMGGEFAQTNAKACGAVTGITGPDVT